jgi:1,2-diacylglycerol 3-alpha-glucosyltransferase
MQEKMKPLVAISSYPPRPCGIATFVEEALEFIHKHMPERPVHIICHADGEGENTHPIIDTSKKNWYEPVAELVKELDPYAVHIQHEYGLYDHVDNGEGDNNEGFLRLLDLLDAYPTVVEPHTVHGRLKESEEVFIKGLLDRATVVILKCDYQKWRLSWTFGEGDWKLPGNITVIPHGARADRRYGDHEIDGIKDELDLAEFKGRRIVGLVGWIQSNKRWDVVLDCWEDIQQAIRRITGENWLLFAAGDMRDPRHKPDFDKYRAMLDELVEKRLARFLRFSPRGDIYYKVMAICDFVILPSIDETQSGTLARIIALNKPYVTTAPMEGLTSQTLENEGGLLFTNKESLKKKLIRLACDEGLRRELGGSLKWYLENRVSWDIVVPRYLQVYEDARQAKATGKPAEYPPEF